MKALERGYKQLQNAWTAPSRCTAMIQLFCCQISQLHVKQKIWLIIRVFTTYSYHHHAESYTQTHLLSVCLFKTLCGTQRQLIRRNTGLNSNMRSLDPGIPLTHTSMYCSCVSRQSSLSTFAKKYTLLDRSIKALHTSSNLKNPRVCLYSFYNREYYLSIHERLIGKTF